MIISSTYCSASTNIPLPELTNSTHGCGSNDSLDSRYDLIHMWRHDRPGRSRFSTMPPPFKVELVAHDPGWADAAKTESHLLAAALGPILLVAHHIGSTSIPNIRAKPVLDLMPVVTSLVELDEHRGRIEEIGYEWWDEFGLQGRRYCTKDDRDTRRRLVQLHCYETGSSEIIRHLAFRDYLRARLDLALAYEQEKTRCQALHPDNTHFYGTCKSAWIKRIEAEALAWHIPAH
jgi:GrpB-like predicted nucleotidyltransferase (UPF0157 family)